MKRGVGDAWGELEAGGVGGGGGLEAGGGGLKQRDAAAGLQEREGGFTSIHPLDMAKGDVMRGDGRGREVAARSAPLAARSAPLAAHSAPLAARSAPLAARSAPLAAHSAPLAAHSAPLAARSAPLAGSLGPPGGSLGPPRSIHHPGPGLSQHRSLVHLQLWQQPPQTLLRPLCIFKE
uniref:Uncharacterized protein n=1 Tax=Knipowitschia caucasica TaxID=637954 RepID=A0AAV2L7E1_KNICA